MPKLQNQLKTVQQRTGANTGNLRTDADRAAFSLNVRTDIAAIIEQLNLVYKPLVERLASESSIEALDLGLSGNVIFTHIEANAASAAAYYDAVLNRPRTIKETIDVLLAELAELENSITTATASDSTYDDSEVRSLINKNNLNLEQLRKDTVGDLYTFDNDGQADLAYPLSQHIDAIGQFFDGFPTTGNTYSSTYPALALNVLLSQITIDTTLDQSVIAGLSDDLSYIRNFIGMDTTGPEMPVYTAHGSVSVVSDGDSLEVAVQKLDNAVASVSAVDLQTAFDNGNVINMPNGTGAGVRLNSNDSTADEVLKINQAASKTALAIETDSASDSAPGISVIQKSQGSTGIKLTSITNSHIVALNDTRPTGSGVGIGSVGFFYRNIDASGADDAVVRIQNDNSSDDQPALRVLQASTALALDVLGDSYFDGDVEITGKLTVAGLIDPTGLVTDYMAASPATPVAGKGVFWSRTDDTPIWTDQYGVDHELNLGGPHASTHIAGASDEIDADQLDIDFTPTFYTPDTAPPEVSAVNHLTAHLAGIDAAIGAAGGAGGENLNQTLTLGNATGGVDINLTDGDRIAGDNHPGPDGNGGNLILKVGEGAGSGQAGDLLIETINAGTGRIGRVGINTATPSFALDVDTSTGYTPGSEAGAGLGNVWAGSTSSSVGAITHRALAGSTNSFALSMNSTGTNQLNFALGGAFLVTEDASTQVAKFDSNGIVVGNFATEPAGETGAIYYNTAFDRFRVFEEGIWYNLHAFRTDTTGVTSNSAGDVTTDDFVFGSTSLDSPAAGEEARFQFDKSTGAFRAGRADTTEWDVANRGNNSAAFGLNNIASGSESSVLGGSQNTVSGQSSAIVAGTLNGVSNTYSSIVAGSNNTITSQNAGILSGSSSSISADYAAIGGGTFHILSGLSGFIGAGSFNTVSGTRSTILAGDSNATAGTNTAIVSGRENNIDADAVNAAIVAGGSKLSVTGDGNTISGGGAFSSIIGAGYKNSISCTERTDLVGEIPSSSTTAEELKASHVIVGGYLNQISNTGTTTRNGEFGFIGGGARNSIDDSLDIWHGHAIVGGFGNTIQAKRYSFIGTGYENQITNAGSGIPSYSAILTGNSNTVDGSTASVILNGQNNTAKSNDHITIVSSNDLTSSTYGSINHGPVGDTSWTMDVVFQGIGPSSAPGTGDYWLALDEVTSPATIPGTHKFIETDSTIDGHYLFEGKFTGHFQSNGGTTNYFIAGKIHAQGYMKSGTWFWVYRTVEGYNSVTTTWLGSNNLEFRRTGLNSTGIVLTVGDEGINHTITVWTKVVFRQTDHLL